MNDSRFKRKKHGHVPGDLSRKTKIAMRENRNLPKSVSPEQAKAFRRDFKHNQRAVMKRRFEKELANEHFGACGKDGKLFEEKVK